MLSALLLQLFTATSPPAFAAPLTATFSASADATVQAARPTQAFGSATSLEVDGSPVKRILLKFTVSGIGSQTVRSATLRIYCIDPSPVGGVFTGLGTAWQESTVTWNNAPAATTPMVRALGRVSSRGWYQVDLTPLVTGDGMIGISIASSSNDGADYASREAGPATAPVLVVQYDAPSPSPSPPPSPSPSPSASPLFSPSPSPSASPLFSPSPSPSASPESDPVLLSVGDIATCSGSGDELTATLLDGMTGTVATLGDQAYPDGSQAAFADCYDPSWGRHRQRTLPAAGNHEYMTGSAGAYFNYFGAAAGDPARGYYAYTLGTWRIIVLNSNCSQASGCGVGSAQEQWLRTELAASGGVNVLAYWHHPRFSSGFHGSDATYEPFWRALYEAGADVVLAGHDHDYERFAPQDPTGILDQPYGIREFVVGTGGAELRAFNPAVPNSEVRDTSTFGILELTLSAASYTWRFLSAGGGTFSDAGQAATHPAPPPDGNAPSVPTGLTASEVSASTIAIAWAAASDDVGVTGYEVSRDGAVVAISAATGFIDHDVLAAQTYEYRVRARDAAGNWSVPSTALSVTTPAIPGGVTAMISSDSFVAADKPTSNYGTAVSLEVDGSPQKAILLQVNVSGLNGRGIRSARLYLYCIDPSNVGGEFHRVPTTWSESTVTWNTTPAADPGVIATLGPVTAGSWYVVDLTGAILADGTYGFKIVSASTNGADYVSRDGISLPRPYLVIETP